MTGNFTHDRQLYSQQQAPLPWQPGPPAPAPGCKNGPHERTARCGARRPEPLYSSDRLYSSDPLSSSELLYLGITESVLYG
jgi:hypothetical protein